MEKDKINVLSLFDGMSCGRLALDRVDIKVDNYYASEIDKYAIAVTQHNFTNTIQLGDITNWREWDIDWGSIDIVIGGSPCQGFSFAGKQLAFDDPRSKLFFVFIDILNYVKSLNPNVKFLLENVRMKKEYLDVITEYIGVEPIKINSALASAQNRVRYYWTNISGIIQPEDKGILLKDILDSSVGVGGAMRGRYLPNGKITQRIETRTDNKMNCLTSASKDSLVVNKCIQIGVADIKGFDSNKRVYSPEGKGPTMTTCQGGNREPKVIIERLGNVNPSGRGMNGEVYGVNGKCPTVTTNKGEGTKILDPNKNETGELHWRKLSPIECERLQTVPDNYTLVPWQKRMMSNSQRYKMLGNGWTIDVIAHIFKNLN